jgi:hypothetical protein
MCIHCATFPPSISPLSSFLKVFSNKPPKQVGPRKKMFKGLLQKVPQTPYQNRVVLVPCLQWSFFPLSCLLDFKLLSHPAEAAHVTYIVPSTPGVHWLKPLVSG